MDNDVRGNVLRWTSRIGWPVFGALLALLLWAAVGNPYTVVPQPTRLPPVDPDIAPRAREPLSAYLGVVRRREMFRQSVVYEVKKKEVANIVGDLVFMGTVQQGDRKRAFILNKKSGQSAFYAVGEVVGDLEIKEIRDDRIVFGHGNETLELLRLM
jgi:hypothetical protein